MMEPLSAREGGLRPILPAQFRKKKAPKGLFSEDCLSKGGWPEPSLPCGQALYISAQMLVAKATGSSGKMPSTSNAWSYSKPA